jgi:hypothetical protein
MPRFLTHLLRRWLPALVLGLLLGAARAETFVVGADGSPASLGEALLRAADGDVIELLPGRYRGVHLVLEGRRLTLRGLGEPRPVIDGEGRPGAHRALVTVRGGEVVLENLEIRGARASDGQGAGVRVESGRVTLRRLRLQDNEHGLHALNDPQGEIVVEASEFGLAPRVVGGLHHLLNVGRIARLSVSGSRFQQGFEGHLIKSRAAVTELFYNMIHDGPRGGASYEVDLPAGGEALLVGNIIGQGRETQNPVMVAYGSEGSAWPRNRLVMAHNTLLNYQWMPAWALRTWRDRLPADAEVVAVNNLVVGGGAFGLVNRGRFEGNAQAAFWMLRDADTYAFELDPGSFWRGRGADAAAVAGARAAPGAEFRWPTGTEPLQPRPYRTPGAYQR